MERISLLIGIGSVMLVLFGVLYLVQKNRTIDIPEGFTTDIEVDIDDMHPNPISKVIKKVAALSLKFADPELWKEAIATSQLSFTERARQQILADRAKSG